MLIRLMSKNLYRYGSDEAQQSAFSLSSVLHQSGRNLSNVKFRFLSVHCQVCVFSLNFKKPFVFPVKTQIRKKDTSIVKSPASLNRRASKLIEGTELRQWKKKEDLWVCGQQERKWRLGSGLGTGVGIDRSVELVSSWEDIKRGRLKKNQVVGSWTQWYFCKCAHRTQILKNKTKNSAIVEKKKDVCNI